MNDAPSVNEKDYLYKLSREIVEETQLLAEEKWILDALSKIKSQRNCLQIERLHLESLRSKLLHNPDSQQPSASTSNAGNDEDTCNRSMSPPSAINLMQAVNPMQSRSRVECGTPILSGQEQLCNEEELNLNVTSTIFAHTLENMEDDAVEDDEDDELEDTMFIDMDMFMNDDMDK